MGNSLQKQFSLCTYQKGGILESNILDSGTSCYKGLSRSMFLSWQSDIMMESSESESCNVRLETLPYPCVLDLCSAMYHPLMLVLQT